MILYINVFTHCVNNIHDRIYIYIYSYNYVMEVEDACRMTEAVAPGWTDRAQRRHPSSVTWQWNVWLQCLYLTFRFQYSACAWFCCMCSLALSSNLEYCKREGN